MTAAPSTAEASVKSPMPSAVASADITLSRRDGLPVTIRLKSLWKNKVEEASPPGGEVSAQEPRPPAADDMVNAIADAHCLEPSSGLSAARLAGEDPGAALVEFTVALGGPLALPLATGPPA